MTDETTTAEPAAAAVPDKPPPPEDPVYCDIHKIAKTRVQTHIGDGFTEWSDPFCPYCVELAAKAEAAPPS